ncbi:MAG: thiamine pyrophosphate-binding protein [Thermoguttaceae bacterium]|nr:thiamine pyrophosphate-binding protein [Thermoguttaceae bacterium]MDW8037970.1 thiamine pyrophosphate-binding protein [Thermoguttaceae bacterium]
MPRSGMHLFLELLREYGVRYLFGNPGTTELPLYDALAAYRQIQLILALQEVPAVAIADGYAQASRQVGVVNVHICCGLGNAMGMLYNAYRAGTPLLLTAGQQDQRMMLEEPILWGEMVEVVRPWTKWAYEVRRVEDLPTAVRRAIQTALMPPTGPVFLSLPLDVQMACAEAVPVRVAPLPDVHVRPPVEALQRAAQLLASAQQPGILVGSRVCEADAIQELVTVAELLGAPVFHEATTSHGRSSFPSDHPLAGPPLPFWSPEVREFLTPFDILLVVGMKLFQQYIYHEPSPLPAHVRVVQMDENPWELNKNYPVEVGLVGHPKPALAELARLLDRLLQGDRAALADKRRSQWTTHFRRQREELRQQAQEQKELRPIRAQVLMDTIGQVLPANAAVVEESPTTTMGSYLERIGAMKDPTGYFAQRGWALGWGLNCAIGVRLAWPDRPVLAIIGDGSAMYGFQGLWTAARYQIPVTFLITNNQEYKILKNCARVLRLPEAMAGSYEGLDLDRPVIDFVGLARSLGVPACRVTEPDALADWLRWGLSANCPLLIEVPVAS